MSYRLITKATLSITSASGTTTEREVDVRAYPAPKRDNAGLIQVDGTEVGYKRTGGKGRGTADHRYMYAVIKSASAYWAITEAEATALVGGQAKLVSIVAAEKPDAANEAGATPGASQVLADEAEPTKAVARRIKGVKATA